MQVTGKNLDVLLIALKLAEEQIHNKIVTCPEPEDYKEKLAELNKQLKSVKRLITKTEEAIHWRGDSHEY